MDGPGGGSTAESKVVKHSVGERATGGSWAKSPKMKRQTLVPARCYTGSDRARQPASQPAARDWQARPRRGCPCRSLPAGRHLPARRGQRKGRSPSPRGGRLLPRSCPAPPPHYCHPRGDFGSATINARRRAGWKGCTLAGFRGGQINWSERTTFHLDSAVRPSDRGRDAALKGRYDAARPQDRRYSPGSG